MLHEDEHHVNTWTRNFVQDCRDPNEGDMRSNRTSCDVILSDGRRPLRVSSPSRERWRQRNVSGAFSALRRLLPTHPPDRKLSKKEILNRALSYISFLDRLVTDQDPRRARGPRRRAASVEEDEKEEEGEKEEEEEEERGEEGLQGALSPDSSWWSSISSCSLTEELNHLLELPGNPLQVNLEKHPV